VVLMRDGCGPLNNQGIVYSWSVCGLGASAVIESITDLVASMISMMGYGDTSLRVTSGIVIVSPARSGGPTYVRVVLTYVMHLSPPHIAGGTLEESSSHHSGS